jgi:hypothetical protein
MREQEIINFSLNKYRLARSFCREECLNGGVCILTRDDINFNTIDLNKFCNNKTFEIRVTKLNSKTIKIVVCYIYRSYRWSLARDQITDMLGG